MIHHYSGLLDDAFDEDGSLKTSMLSSLVEETLGHYLALQEKIASKDPVQIQEAIQEIAELKQALKEKIAENCEKAGFKISQLPDIESDTNKLSPQDHSLIQEIKEKFKQLA